MSSDNTNFDTNFQTASETFNAGLIAVIVLSVLGIIATVVIAFFVYKYLKKHGLPAINISTYNPHTVPSAFTPLYTTVANSQLQMATIENFLNEIAREKPIRFFPEQLAGFTQNYSTKLGSGGFGAVYKGTLPNGMPVAVKVLHGNLDKRVEEQFMAEVGTIGRTYHINLVRPFGFCFDTVVRALVYEYMENGALDNILLKTDMAGGSVSFTILHKIVVGTAKGIRYLHEECQQKIIHYDIKPGNILLDDKFNAKVADFGLAKLLSRDNTHVSMTGIRGTPGYAAPEMWMGTGVTEACDVYSFGMLQFEIVGRRRNYVEASNGDSSDSQQWLPRIVWERYNSGQLTELVAAVHGLMDEEEREKAERMCKVALWCVQYQVDVRPPMSKVVKMLEGEMNISPPMNPFQHLMVPIADLGLWSQSSSTDSSSPLY
ncbi:Protein kinase family protein [Rhynchospora pubera]|uniref:Protein kinase family protein n=1 Tax=Rhynchospora pubera TaxID=906938 RepID=A0AAV8F9Y0_9POAL|nr:Protein kinase family protein [Rhynchospora pubera]